MIPAGITLGLLAARVSAVHPLGDPVNGTVPDSLTLGVPTLYLVLAPVFTLWDGISMLSMTRLKGFLAGLLLLYATGRLLYLIATRARRPKFGGIRFLLRELGVFGASLGLLLVFLAVGALWHRPMLSLAGVSPGDRVVDFHSHTNASHDVGDTWMKGFNTDANLRWHSRAGFDAVFITDHNVVSREGLVAGREWSVTSPESNETGAAATSPVMCPGIEVSAWKAHIILLGDTLPVDRRRYNQSLPSLLQLLQTSDSAYGSLSVASLPEYRRNHWDRLDTMAEAGLDGFEIVNASPKANELTRSERDRVIGAARAYDRFVVGVSDSHGWGATSMVWNLVSVPPATSAAGVCPAVLNRLMNGFEAVRVIERHRLRPDDGWPIVLTPIGMVWETWRSMGWPLTASWLLWIWLVPRLARRDQRR